MQGVLELHAAYPGNKKELAGKTGPKPMWPTPELIPENKGEPEVRPADGPGGCVHCHQAHEAAIWTLRKTRRPIPDIMVRTYPMPDDAGFSLDPKERARVAGITPDSPADRAGLRIGDGILRFDSQPILSIADVQWVLHHAKDDVPIKIQIERSGERAEITLTLPRGWRQKVDFTWREWTWGIRHRLLGTERLEGVSNDEKKRLAIQGTALRIQELPPDWVKDKNPSASQFCTGDVIVEVDGKNDLGTEADLLAYLMQKKPPGSIAELTVLREGKNRRIALKIP